MNTTTTTMNTTNVTINVNFLESLLPEEKQGIISAVIDNGGYVADNHRDGEMIKVDGLVILGSCEICPTFHKSSRYWSLNGLYMNEIDEKVHLSTWSCGGTMKASSSFERSVQEYNESILDFLNGHKIVGYIEL